MRRTSKFTRRAAQRKPRDVIYVVTEGKNTEPSYLENIKAQLRYRLDAHLQLESARHSSIFYLIKKTDELELESGDELWIVLDRDEGFHSASDYKTLAAWEQESKQHHVALSNPRFEYWLLLHFEEHPTPANAKSESYLERKGYIPGYARNGKKISSDFVFPLDYVRLAMERAESTTYPTPQQPDCIGSGMHLLMHSIFAHLKIAEIQQRCGNNK